MLPKSYFSRIFAGLFSEEQSYGLNQKAFIELWSFASF